MPSLGMLTINALAAADSVIVPVQAHYLPLKGMTQLIKTIGKVQRQLNPNLKIDGVLLTLADMRTKLVQGQQRIAFEKIMRNISEFLKRLFQWLSQRQKAVQQDRAFMSMTRMELLQRRMQNLRGR